MNQSGKRFHINGVVQGVGFRPFIYKLASDFSLKGWVQNNSSGVLLEVFGSRQDITNFEEAIHTQLPPLARIESFSSDWIDYVEYPSFTIQNSQKTTGAFSFISPDVAICPDCARELLNPSDRRFRYPFINCTNCGPRFSIIQDMPYDRPATTMAGFPLCPDCQAEYEDPLNRRFHAQPIACHTCGPQLSYIRQGEILATRDDALQLARKDIREGKIVAIKGLGGYLLACDAHNPRALQELRKRKRRSDKAFALMAADLNVIQTYCQVTVEQSALLNTRAMPIVILEQKEKTALPEELAPGQATLGVMLPYTPLHILLCQPEPGYPDLLVMTSANISEEPIIYRDEEMHRLDDLADSYLTHNRPIHIRMDDSVIRYCGKDPIIIRRSRGYAPEPVKLPLQMPSVFAAGALLKNTFTLTRDQNAFMSPFIGDLENLETYASYEHAIQHFLSTYKMQPQAYACDLHPDFLSTRYARSQAERNNKPLIQVQHHHAHLAACLAENSWKDEQPAIGVILDGTGLGKDDIIWGGEFLVGGYKEAERVYHLEYLPLPGGDSAIHTPAKIALAYLHQLGLEWDDRLAPVKFFTQSQREILKQQLNTKLNVVQTSSMGRLFDAVAALAGGRQVVGYEGQAAIELESAATTNEQGHYPYDTQDKQILLRPLFQGILDDVYHQIPLSIISARFHNTISDLIVSTCNLVRKQTGISTVALSGGVMQNVRLVKSAVTLLESNQFQVLCHRALPPNDGCISYGQAVIAGANLKTILK